MDLNTRCPQCGTTFSASLAQLQLRKGYIRCINCAHIFDGYESVVSTEDVDVEPTLSMPSVVRQRPHDNDKAHTVAPMPSIAQGPRAPDFTISTGVAAITPQRDESPSFHVGKSAPDQSEPLIGTPAVRTRSAAVHADDRAFDQKPLVYVEPRHTAPEYRGSHEPDFLDRDASRSPGIGSILWGALSIAGLVVLLAQLGFVYRSQLANSVPMLRPVLEQACERLHCQVAYSRRIDKISIMSSALRATPGAPAVGGDAQAAASSSMILQVTLRNTFDKPQEWPTLILDLTDFSGALILRKNLPPESYLPAHTLQQPFAASSEIAVSLPIVLKGLQVNGYKVDKFFQ